MRTTIKGICLNLNNSEYYFKHKGLVFYFSSEFYKNKFERIVNDYIENETLKTQIRYNVKIQMDLLFMVALYRKIEKRGFRIYDEENKKEIKPSCVFITSMM